MKVVVLAGGYGSRLAEHTEAKPKPMVEIGPHPILWHVLSIYGAQGLSDFVIACGYKAEVIKRWFSDWTLHHADFEVSLKDGARKILRSDAPDWRVSVVDTGLHTMTGGRLKRLSGLLSGGTFLATYGDGVGNVDVQALLRFHRAHGKLATVTAVRPPARFGSLELQGDRVAHFSEKPQSGEGWINGGFFVFEPGVLDFIDGDPTSLEKEPLEKLASIGQLCAYRHEGFWHPMDTVRDKKLLDDLWESGSPPWKVW